MIPTRAIQCFVMDIDPDTIRDEQRRSWSIAAAGWGRIRRDMSKDAVSRQMVEMADIRPGQRVLDLACGSGSPTFLVAEVVGPAGYVLGLDLSEQMLGAA